MKVLLPSLYKQVLLDLILMLMSHQYTKLHFKLSWILSGNSKVNADWKSPLAVAVELAGDTTTLNDVNIIGISVHRQ